MSNSEELTKLAELIGGKAWGADKGKPRIYMRSSRDRKVFFMFPDAVDGDCGCLGGAALKVYIDDCGQAGNWYKSQRQREMHGQRGNALALAAACDGGDWELAEQLVEYGDDFSDVEIDELASHLVNDRLYEARSLVAELVD